MYQDTFEQPLKEGQLFLPGKGERRDNGNLDRGQTIGKGSNVVDGKRQVVSQTVNW